jgi:hypothetical protein
MSTNKNETDRDLSKAVSEQINKKPHLYVNTDFSEIGNGNDDIIESRDSNNYRFKTYINGIVEIQNLQDFIIRLSVVTSLFTIGCPRLLMDRYFLYKDKDNDNIVNIFLTVSISEQIILTLVSSYFIMTEDLDGIYNIQYNQNIVPNLIVIGKVEAFWAKYYSLLGIALALNAYFVNGYINAIYTYLLLFGMFKLWVFRLLKNKKLL